MNDKLSATHARWRNSVLAHNITDVCHVPGITNIADGLSRQYKNTPKKGDDGSQWTVSPDWEENEELVFEINHITTTPDITALLAHFKDEPVLQ